MWGRGFNNIFLQLKMRKRYEDIPLQFMPKHSHKYLMRKTLVNTKFQWLMKYINQQNIEPLQSKKLSNAITIAPKDNLENKHKILRPNKSNHFFHDSSSHQHDGSQILKRRIKSRTCTEPTEDILFMEKRKLKKSLLLSRSKSKQFPFLFDRDCHQSTANRQMTTTQGIRRSKTSDCRKPVRDKQNFTLTPWILPEEGHQANDFASYF